MELPDRNERDDEAGALFLLLMLLHRIELTQLLGDPPDVENVPAEFWERVEQQTSSTLFLVLLDVFVSSARLHGASGEELILEAVHWSQAKAETVAAQVTNTSRERLRRYADEWRTRQENGEEIPPDEIQERTESIFGETRAEIFAVDTVTAAQSAGGEFAVESNSGDIWRAILDERVCPICSALDGTTRAEWGETFPSGPGAHPLCRCVIEYVSILVTN